MLALSYAIAGLFAAGLLTELITALVAPMGYQDERGFHLGSEEGVPSTLPRSSAR